MEYYIRNKSCKIISLFYVNIMLNERRKIKKYIGNDFIVLNYRSW